MSGLSMSKAAVADIWQSNKDQREAIIHHTEKLTEHQDTIEWLQKRLEAVELYGERLKKLEGWALTFEAVSVWRRLRWLLTGR